MPALRRRRVGRLRRSERRAAVPLQEVRQELQRADRHPAGRVAEEGAWLEFGRSLSEGDTVVASAERCGVAVSTAFRWRHCSSYRQTRRSDPTGIVEADEAFVLLSYKGSRVWQRAEKGQPLADPPDRKARKRGGKAMKRGLSHEQVPILVAADRSGNSVTAVLPSVYADAIKAVLEPVLGKDALLVTDGYTSYPPCAAALGVSHEALNLSAGERVCGELHIQTVNSLHERIKTFLCDAAGSPPNISTTICAVSPHRILGAPRHPAPA